MPGPLIVIVAGIEVAKQVGDLERIASIEIGRVTRNSPPGFG